MPADLTAWADELGAVAADETGMPNGLDLLGLSRRAGVFPALLWNGSRIHRAASAAPVVEGSVDRVALLDGLTLLATACGVERESSMLTTAVEAGLNEAERADTVVQVAQGPTAVAGVTRWVTAAAVCAFVATGGSPDRSSSAARALVDVAGALLVVHPLTRTTDDNGLLLGHTLAAGWLATRLHAVGVVGVAETFELTVTSVVGAS
ncbi:hypothetical protein BA895_00560 [Humibacillus sp. DSM 29435]|uniref:hypothetical protein n=1 Tax=Humibacillus sp. DSM 29435 TaxID=1869167 RepID=UPI0008733A2B|nr:hypothetical protein [Humibacillus sp. DSM 29435]OFE18727.1 hypothetical protein BA895_00560 [Humibacillus sp. DSM 29435]